MISVGTSRLLLFTHIAFIPIEEAPFTSLLKESPICNTSPADKPTLFNANSNNSLLGLYALASSLVNTPVGLVR